MVNKSTGVVFGLVVVMPVCAQVVTTAEVSGRVHNSDQIAVPLARVVLESAQTVRETTTSANGKFRLPMLSPGEWTLTIEKTGYQTLKTRLVLHGGSITSNSWILAPIPVASVDIVGERPNDVEGLTINPADLSALPLQGVRDVSSLAALSPGVTSGGAAAGGSNPSISGASATENVWIIDGVTVTDPKTGFQGFFLAPNFLELAEIRVGALPPEYSAMGGVISATTKSGGNTVQGQSWVTWDPRGIMVKPKSNRWFSQTPSNTNMDIGATLGGPVVKDRLFYLVGAQGCRSEAPESGQVVNSVGLRSSRFQYDEYQGIAKLSWLPSSQHLLTGLMLWNRHASQQEHKWVRYGDQDEGNDAKTDRLTFSAAYDGTILPSLLASAQVGWSRDQRTQDPTLDTPTVADYLWYMSGPGSGLMPIGYPFTRGGGGQAMITNVTLSREARGNLVWTFRENRLKMGVTYLSASWGLDSRLTGPSLRAPHGEGLAIVPDNYGNLSYILSNQQWDQGGANATYKGMYIQHSWDVLPTLQVGIGLRSEIQEQTAPSGATYFQFNSWTDNLEPRFAVTWKPCSGTQIRASWSQVYERIPMVSAMRSGGSHHYLLQVYYASTGKARYNYGNGAWTISGSPDVIQDYNNYFREITTAEGTKLPRRTEYWCDVEKLISPTSTVGLSWMYRRLDHPIETSIILDQTGHPVDGEGWMIFWNPGPGPVSWRTPVGHTTPGKRLTADWTGFPEAYNDYHAVTLRANWTTSRWHLRAFYTWSRLRGNYEGPISNISVQNEAHISSQWDAWTYVGTGLLPTDCTHNMKILGSWVSGAWSLGWLASWRSGTPISYFDNGMRTYGSSDHDYLSYGDAIPANRKLGQFGRTPSLTRGDARVTYTLALRDMTRLVTSFEVFNITNRQSATNVVQKATSAQGLATELWGVESSWQRGRSYRVGVTLRF